MSFNCGRGGNKGDGVFGMDENRQSLKGKQEHRDTHGNEAIVANFV